MATGSSRNDALRPRHCTLPCHVHSSLCCLLLLCPVRLDALQLALQQQQPKWAACHNGRHPPPPLPQRLPPPILLAASQPANGPPPPPPDAPGLRCRRHQQQGPATPVPSCLPASSNPHCPGHHHRLLPHAQANKTGSLPTCWCRHQQEGQPLRAGRPAGPSACPPACPPQHPPPTAPGVALPVVGQQRLARPPARPPATPPPPPPPPWGHHTTVTCRPATWGR